MKNFTAFKPTSRKVCEYFVIKSSKQFMNFQKYGIRISTEKNFKIKNGINPNVKTCLLGDKFNSLFRRKNIGLLTDRTLFDHRQNNIEFYKSIKSYRGLRHRNNYPVRGQRTHTNAHKKAIKIPNFR